MPAAETTTLLLSGIIAAIAAASAAALPEIAGAAQSLNVLDDSKLRLVCIAGSLGGAFLSIGLFPVNGIRPLALKLTCSAIAGVLFSPMVMRWLNITSDTDSTLFISGVVAFLSWASLQILGPRAVQTVVLAIEKFFGLKPADKTPTVLLLAAACLFLPSCGTSVTTPKGYTFTVHVDGEAAAILVSKKFGASGKEARRVLP